MKLAFFPIKRNSPNGGSEQLWAYTALEACYAGHDVCVFPYNFKKQHHVLSELKSSGAQIYFRPLRNLSVPILQRVYIRLESWINAKINIVHSSLKYLKFIDIDLLVINQGSWYDLSDDIELMRAIHNYKLPYVIICHSFQDSGLLNRSRKRSILSIYKSAKQVYFVSKRQKDVVEKYLGYRVSHSKIVLNPLNIETYEVYPQPKSPLKFVMISSLVTRWKGHDLLLEALSHQKWKDREWNLHIYGKGEDEQEIKQLILFFKLQNRVKLMGYCNKLELVLKEAHVLVVPSRVEAAPLVIYEAFLKGRPVLGTDIGDIGDIIKDGINGFLAEAPHPKYIDRALERLWENRNGLDELGKSAFISAYPKFKDAPEKVFLNHLIEDAQD